MQSGIRRTSVNFHRLWDRLQSLTGCVDEIALLITHICPQLDWTGYIYFALYVVTV